MPIISTTDEASAVLSRSPQGTGLNSKAIAMLWDDTAKAKAFFSSRILHADILTAFRDQISAVVSGGATSQQAVFAMQEFLRSKGDTVLNSMGFLGLEDAKASNNIGELGWTRLRLIVEQNVRMAQQAVEWRRAQDQIAELPYVRYKTAEDDKVRPTHAALDGKIFRVNDPGLATIWPPRDFNCRCWMEPVDEEEAHGNRIASVSGLPPEVTATPPSGYSFRPDLWDMEIQPLKPTWDTPTVVDVQKEMQEEAERSAQRKERAKNKLVTPPFSIPESAKTKPVVDRALARPWVIPPVPLPIDKPISPPPTVPPPTPSTTVVDTTKPVRTTSKPVPPSPSTVNGRAASIVPDIERLLATATRASQANDWGTYIAALLAVEALRRSITTPESITNGNIHP